MPSPFDLLLDIIHSTAVDTWNEKNKKALAALFGTRYPKRAEQSVALRAPDMRGNEAGVAYAAYIHPSNPDQGAYGGMSFAIFPVEGGPALVTMVVGTQGLAPDETILGRPGHARKIQAICGWLNQRFGHGVQVAWAKQDPTRVDVELPTSIQNAWAVYDRALKRYGRYIYAMYRPTDERAGTLAALTALLDTMFQDRGHTPLKEFQTDASSTQSDWFEYLMPKTNREDVVGMLNSRRYVIIQGPPGTGKTRMAREILREDYGGIGETIQFHPNTTYENFVGGLAPLQESAAGNGALGISFRSKTGISHGSSSPRQ